MRSIGIHQIFALVVEPIRDPRLGRSEEAYSEDPYLCSRYTVLFVGYSDNSAGVSAGSLVRSDRTFFLKLGYAWMM